MQSTNTTQSRSCMNAEKLNPNTTAHPTDDTEPVSSQQISLYLTAKPKAEKNQKGRIISCVLVFRYLVNERFAMQLLYLPLWYLKSWYLDTTRASVSGRCRTKYVQLTLSEARHRGKTFGSEPLRNPFVETGKFDERT
jgi:hypothetical protein